MLGSHRGALGGHERSPERAWGHWEGLGSLGGHGGPQEGSGGVAGRDWGVAGMDRGLTGVRGGAVPRVPCRPQKRLREALAEPDLVVTDFGKAERPPMMHWGWQGLHRFIRQHGRPPRPRHQVGTRGGAGRGGGTPAAREPPGLGPA